MIAADRPEDLHRIAAVISGVSAIGNATLAISDIEHVEPELFEIHGELGLLWSKGTVIHLCGGCIPDHDLRLVILDRATLDPLSEVLALPRHDQGGLLRHSTAVIGDDLAIASRLQLHTRREAALGFARCVP